MPNPKLATPEQSFATRRRRALKKQARRQVKRREAIMAGLTDRFTAVLLDHTAAGLLNADDAHVPLDLLPTRKLRARVAELNLESESFYLAPPSPEDCSRPDPALMMDHRVAAKDADEPAGNAPASDGEDSAAVTGDPTISIPVRRPRRRGRNPAATSASIPLHPYLSDQEAALHEILALCTSGPVTPGIGRRHPCPCSHLPAGTPEGGATVIDPRPLTVYPTANGDLVFRCQRCGFCLDSVEFLHHAGQGMFPTLADAARWLGDGRTPAAAQLAGYERLGILRPLFERGRARYRQTLPRGQGPRLFGDWGLLDVRQLADLFPDRRFPKFLPAECLGRLGRDGFGRPTVLDLCTVRCFTRLYRLELREWESATCAGKNMVLFTARWADYLPWRQLIVCHRYPLARDLELALSRWPDAERLPLAMLDDGGVRGRPPAAAMASETSLAEVWLALRGTAACATAGLAFCGVEPGATVVHVRRLPPVPGCRVEGEHFIVDEDRLQKHPLLASRAAFCEPTSALECVEDVAATLVAEKEHQPLAVAVADVLNQGAGTHPAVRQRLVEAVAGRAHVPVEELVAGVDLVGLHVWPGGPFALHAPGGTSYVARAGCYWRLGSREKAWTPVSNFRLRLVGDGIDAKGKVTHHGHLEVGGGKGAEVALSTAVLESAKRLQTELTKAAVRGGLDLPVISDPKARRLLPELVKVTRAQSLGWGLSRLRPPAGGCSPGFAPSST